MSIHGTLRTAAAGLAALALAAGCALAQSPNPSPASPPGPAPQAEQNRLPRVLVWADVQTGFHHDSINRAMSAIEQMGRESGLWETYLRTDSQLITREPILGQGSRYGGRRVNARNLDDFDVVFFLGSGEGNLSDAQKADLLAWASEEGNGFVGGHASTIGFYDWPEFGAMLGGVMAGEFRTGPAQLLVQDPAFPGGAAFPTTHTEQYQYLDDTYDPSQVRVIIRMDPAHLTAEQLAQRPDGDFPVAWARTYGEGRVYVSTLGHEPSAWDDPAVQNLYFEGVKWALGLTDADVSPNP